MTPKERATMQQALEALEELHYSSGTVVAARMYESATAALREALAVSEQRTEEQAEQEPVAIVDANDDGYWADILPDRSVKVGQKLYTAPVRTKDLTDGEMEELCRKYARFELIREAIDADREKNK